ncbi:hypothetical protein ACFL4W_02115 [Planctomycetota bacterium]
MKTRHWILWIFCVSLFLTPGCGKKPETGEPAESPAPDKVTETGAVPPPESALTPKAAAPVTEDTVLTAKDLSGNIISGLNLSEGMLTLYRFKDDFTSDSLSQYKVRPSTSFGVDEYGVIDTNVDAALATVQTHPDHSLLIETYDNDSFSLVKDIVPTVKGFLSLDIWPVRLWPTSGRVTLEVRDTGERRIVFPLAGSDYKNPTIKQFNGKKLSVPGGKPFFSSIRKHNIYQPNENIPSSERRWWPMRLLFRPDYAAGSLDGSVCRKIDDPDKMPIIAKRIELSFNQIETYIRALRFKALLGEALSPARKLTAPAWVAVSWDGDTPDKTRIGLQIRGAADTNGLAEAAWIGPDADTPYYLEPGPIPAELARMKFMQIRVLLKADQNAEFEASPALRSVTISQEAR